MLFGPDSFRMGILGIFDLFRREVCSFQKVLSFAKMFAIQRTRNMKPCSEWSLVPQLSSGAAAIPPEGPWLDCPGVALNQIRQKSALQPGSGRFAQVRTIMMNKAGTSADFMRAPQ